MRPGDVRNVGARPTFLAPPLGLHGFFKHWDFVVKKADKQNYTREHFLPRLENVQKSRFVGGVRYGTA